jgi:3-methylcrotonyl-CoA carboxylase alpha subunit
MFESLLIANRGEIAVRVIETARRLGIRTVAVYSEADEGALHVRVADEALPIGPAPTRESYLRGDHILEAAKRSGARAIHPGYGFLSENADFAEACTAAGVCFVGPPAEAIRAMGLKDAAKQRMEAASVPVVPGHHADAQDLASLAAAAEAVGYPVLIKAVAGGGGRGMRRVDDPAELEAGIEGARREAEASFGDARLLLEKYLTKPRHIELQVFADDHGHVVHLFERDCSLQRRHQKVVEEAPAPGLEPAMRAAMGDAAVRAARAIDYRGAGTVEFIVDVSDGIANAPFYFMEMNTRLQVEHPVTEAVTGLDLVEWQLRVAAGEPLPRLQDQLTIEGHAIEVRVYAEDPSRRYLPQTGRLVRWRPPAASDHVRVDSGVAEHDLVSHHYDPMLAKLIVHGSDRDEALHHLGRALDCFEVAGPRTNLPLLAAVAAHPAFVAADLDTGFLDQHAGELIEEPGALPSDLLCLMVAGLIEARASGSGRSQASDPWSPWSTPDTFRLNEDGFDVIHLRNGNQALEVRAGFAAGQTRLEWKDSAHVLENASLDDETISARIDGVRQSAHFVQHGDSLYTLSRGRCLRLDVQREIAEIDEDAAGGGAIRSPMPGRIIEVLTREGEKVKAGQVLLRLEAMKMEHALAAPIDGVVGQLSAAVGAQVEEGATLLVVS